MNHQPPAQLPLGFDAAPVVKGGDAPCPASTMACPGYEAGAAAPPDGRPTLVPICDYDPRELAGLPIGQFHCPVCGDVVLAGMEHPPRDDWADLAAFVAGAR